MLERIKEACQEIIDRENEDLDDIEDPNCYAAGYGAGAIAAVNEILACLEEEKPIMRATVYHAGTDSFYDALVLKKLSKEDLEAKQNQGVD